MSALTLVLDNIRDLQLIELRAVERAINERLEIAGYTPEELKAMQSLVDAGLMKEIKPRCGSVTPKYHPVAIVGKPLSETIIEERR